LVTEKLCKSFSQGGLQQHVLKNLDLTIREGDFTVIMGASGAGKSTLLYLLSGMDRPSLGSVSFAGERLEHQNNDQLAVFRRRNCGFVFQQIYLMDNMSLMDNVMASGLLLSRNRRKVAERAVELFARVRLTQQDWCKFPAQLSGGEAQRGAIVRALINKPTVLFADEPTGALNSTAGDAVLDLLSELHRGGQTVVMVTHDLRSACRGNRVLYLRDGVICGEQLLGTFEGEGEDAGGGGAVRDNAGEPAAATAKPATAAPTTATSANARRATLDGFLAQMGW
jgi:putative ABC transport system ATP-binding protein